MVPGVWCESCGHVLAAQTEKSSDNSSRWDPVAGLGREIEIIRFSVNPWEDKKFGLGLV